MSMNILVHVMGFVLLVQFSMALYEIEVHRMLGYEEGDHWLGSKVHSFTMVAAHYAGESLRRLAMIRFSEIDEQTLEELFQRKPGGILIILPQQLEDKAQELVIWTLIYEFIAPRAENMPVYFCWESDALLKLYKTKTSKSATDELSSDVQFQVTSTEPKLLQQLTFEDIYVAKCVNPQSSFDDLSTYYRQSNPALMVVVGGDSNLPASDLSVPLENQGFQLALYFQLVKSLKYVYQTYQKRDQNILFYFTSTSSLNYDGLRQFFSKPENQKLADQIQNVLILDTLYSNGPFELQVQPSGFKSDSQNTELTNILKILQQCFSQQGLPVQQKTSQKQLIKNKDVNVLRLTSIKEDSYPNVLVNQPKQSFNMLRMHNAIFQSLLKIAYNVNQNQTEVKTYDELLDQEQDEDFLEGIYQFFNSTNRHVTNIQRDSKYSTEISKMFTGLFKSSQKAPYIYKERKYLASVPQKANVIRFISAFLDLYIFIAIAAWLALLFFVFKVVQSNKRQNIDIVQQRLHRVDSKKDSKKRR